MSVADGSALLSARLREAWACVELDGLDRCVVVMRGSWSLRGGSVPVVIGVCGCGVRACRSSGGVRVVGPVCSSHCWPVAVLSSRLVVTGPLLLCRCSTVGLLGSGSLPRGWSAARLSLTRGWSWSLVRLLVRRALLSRCSACLSITGLSARPLLSCLLFVHQSVCSSHGRWLVARPSAARRCSVYWSRNWPVPGLSARSSLVHLITHRSSVYSSLTGLSIRLSRVLPVVGLLDSSLVHG